MMLGTLPKFYKKIGVNCEPIRVTRLGASNEKKMRTIKIVMKRKADKDMVMTNLKHLKGTEDSFGKVRITDDYTLEERNLIKDLVKQAESKSQNYMTQIKFTQFEAAQKTVYAWCHLPDRKPATSKYIQI